MHPTVRDLLEIDRSQCDSCSSALLARHRGPCTALPTSPQVVSHLVRQLGRSKVSGVDRDAVFLIKKPTVRGAATEPYFLAKRRERTYLPLAHPRKSDPNAPKSNAILLEGLSAASPPEKLC